MPCLLLWHETQLQVQINFAGQLSPPYKRLPHDGKLPKEMSRLNANSFLHTAVSLIAFPQNKEQIAICTRKPHPFFRTDGWRARCWWPTSRAPRMAADTPRNFADPPDTARPHVYWYWINGNISRGGITADLEAMARVGIGGAGIFNIGGHSPAGPVKMLSPEWRELMKHAICEAKRLGIEINLNNSMTGWSSSGGPWITPELAMQRVTWSEVTVGCGEDVDAITLPQPPSNLGFYRDVAVLAFPTPPAECRRKTPS